MMRYYDANQGLYFTLKYIAHPGKPQRTGYGIHEATHHAPLLEVTPLYDETRTLLHPYLEELCFELDRQRLEQKLFSCCNAHGPLLISEQRRGPRREFPF